MAHITINQYLQQVGPGGRRAAPFLTGCLPAGLLVVSGTAGSGSGGGLLGGASGGLPSRGLAALSVSPEGKRGLLRVWEPRAKRERPQAIKEPRKQHKMGNIKPAPSALSEIFVYFFLSKGKLVLIFSPFSC